jgi:excisionase family DNA binding protein
MQQEVSQHASSSQEPYEPLLLTIPQVAKSLGISRAMVYALLAKNEGPPVIRLGRSVRVSAASLRRWVEEQEGEQQMK